MFQAECQHLYLQFFIQLACLQHLNKWKWGIPPVPEQPTPWSLMLWPVNIRVLCNVRCQLFPGTLSSDLGSLYRCSPELGGHPAQLLLQGRWSKCLHRLRSPAFADGTQGTLLLLPSWSEVWWQQGLQWACHQPQALPGVEGLGAGCLVANCVWHSCDLLTLFRNGCGSCIFLVSVPKGSLFP